MPLHLQSMANPGRVSTTASTLLTPFTDTAAAVSWLFNVMVLFKLLLRNVGVIAVLTSIRKTLKQLDFDVYSYYLWKRRTPTDVVLRSRMNQASLRAVIRAIRRSSNMVRVAYGPEDADKMMTVIMVIPTNNRQAAAPEPAYRFIFSIASLFVLAPFPPRRAFVAPRRAFVAPRRAQRA